MQQTLSSKYLPSLQNNGLQHFPTVPTATFIYRMEKLFSAYLNPKMYHERDMGITNNPEKIANYLSGSDYPEVNSLNIVSCRNLDGLNCWYFPPHCVREPDLEFVD